MDRRKIFIYIIIVIILIWLGKIYFKDTPAKKETNENETTVVSYNTKDSYAESDNNNNDDYLNATTIQSQVIDAIERYEKLNDSLLRKGESLSFTFDEDGNNTISDEEFSKIVNRYVSAQVESIETPGTFANISISYYDDYVVQVKLGSAFVGGEEVSEETTEEQEAKEETKKDFFAEKNAKLDMENATTLQEQIYNCIDLYESEEKQELMKNGTRLSFGFNEKGKADVSIKEFKNIIEKNVTVETESKELEENYAVVNILKNNDKYSVSVTIGNAIAYSETESSGDTASEEETTIKRNLKPSSGVS